MPMERRGASGISHLRSAVEPALRALAHGVLLQADSTSRPWDPWPRGRFCCSGLGPPCRSSWLELRPGIRGAAGDLTLRGSMRAHGCVRRLQ